MNIVAQLSLSNDDLKTAKILAAIAIPSAIATIANGSANIATRANGPNEFISLPIPIDTTANIPAINIAVTACLKPIGCIICSTFEDNAIPADMATIIIGNIRAMAATFPIPML